MNNKFKETAYKYIKESDMEKTVDKKAKLLVLYKSISKAALEHISDRWSREIDKKQACYFSAEYLMGRMIDNNLSSLGFEHTAKEILDENGFSPNAFEEIDDDALGNGGLGRLAACFLDSAATMDIPLNGYGVRYKYGLFKQYFDNGFQKEKADNWTENGDPWSVRRDEDTELVSFLNQTVKAVPYDMPIIGLEGRTINTLRLWQSEPVNAFDFESFNKQEYNKAVEEKNRAEELSYVLYPNDDEKEGKILRLKQQYFFTSASLQSMVKNFVKKQGTNFDVFSDFYVVQLNDTHPVVAIPEFIRILMEIYHLDFEKSFNIASRTFAYTNHTILAEALEKWGIDIFTKVVPSVYPYVVMINNRLQRDLNDLSIIDGEREKYNIISNNQVHMASLAIYTCFSTNGVAQIHTNILIEKELNHWYKIYPERFNNKTNGITQRRWLAFCNKELSDLIAKNIGNGWIQDLDQLKNLKPKISDPDFVSHFIDIKQEKKIQLMEYIEKKENFIVNPNNIFDIQIKRLHEYKRQLLNALSIVDIYLSIKDGSLKDFYPTTFLFGAKAFPSYKRAKTIIKFINEIARVVNMDEDVNRQIQVLFVSDYNVSYAEKLIPAADISEQISTAGKEASGTGNMKFMLNGAVTLGTMDGANVEIVEQAGSENNYIFGAEVEDLRKIKDVYDPKKLYDENPRIKRVVDSLIDGTFSDNDTGIFKALHTSLLNDISYSKADQYFLLLDFIDYCDTKLKANRDYKNNKVEFSKKCLYNIASAGKFSSDRTIREYSRDIWNV